jgi:RNA polymerase sigma-70 factor (ECF subfamily)
MKQVQVIGYRAVQVARSAIPDMKEKNPSDAEAVLAIRTGDRQAYRAIVERYMKRAYGIALTFVGSHQDAMDVSQMAFIRAYRNLRRYDPARPFFPWFYRILRNICLDHLKRASHSCEIPLEDIAILGTTDRDLELRQMLWRAMEQLPVEQREAIMLYYFQGMSYKEVAEVLGRPIGTVMSSLHYAKRKLRAVISGLLDQGRK